MERVDKAEIRYKRNLMVVRLRKEEMTNNEVSKIVGLCPSRVSTIWSKYKKGGPDALRITKWGRGKGEKRKLSPAQEREVINLLLGKPKRVVVGLGFSLWSKDAIREAVWQKFQIDLPLRTTSDYLRRWGVSPRKPGKNSKTFQDWYESEYPKIANRARKEKAEILWCDYWGRKRGDGNGVAISNNIDVISAIKNQGEIRFMLYEKPLKRKDFRLFMSRLNEDIIGCGKERGYLIVCDHPLHDQDSHDKKLPYPNNIKKRKMKHLTLHDKRLNCIRTAWRNPSRSWHNHYRNIEIFFRPTDN